MAENCLILIQQLWAEKQINDEERDSLKDMVFDEDSKLFGLLQRYSDEHEADELRRQVIAYVKVQGDFDMNTEAAQY